VDPLNWTRLGVYVRELVVVGIDDAVVRRASCIREGIIGDAQADNIIKMLNMRPTILNRNK
jgi:hypothetical protein